MFTVSHVTKLLILQKCFLLTKAGGGGGGGGGGLR